MAKKKPAARKTYTATWAVHLELTATAEIEASSREEADALAEKLAEKLGEAVSWEAAALDGLAVDWSEDQQTVEVEDVDPDEE